MARPQPTPRYTPQPTRPQPRVQPAPRYSPQPTDPRPGTGVDIRVPDRPVTPTTPPIQTRRRTVPYDPRPRIGDRYRPPSTAPAPDRGQERLRRRYEKDIDRADPTPAPSPRPHTPPNAGRPRPGTPPVAERPAPGAPRPPGKGKESPVPRPRTGVVPRYRTPRWDGPGDVAPKAAPRDPAQLRPRDPGSDPRSGRTPTGSSPRITPRSGPRQRIADWTFGRSDRRFSNGKPWGVNAAGNRFYGYWHTSRYSPYCFYWGYVPSWCRWGWYCYPVYCSWYWPYHCWSSSWSSSYVYYWDSHDRYRSRYWYWPSSAYLPSTLYDYDIYYYDYGSAAPSSSVSVSLDTSATPGERLRVGGAGAEDEAPAKERIALTFVDLGDYYFRAGRYEDAADSYRKALALLPEDPTLHFLLADAVFALGDYHYAAFLLGRALEIDPEMAGVETDKREFYDDRSRFEEQMTTLRRYVEEKPYDAAATLVLGHNLRMSGDREGAVKAFERVLEIDRRNPAATAFLAALRGDDGGGAAAKAGAGDEAGAGADKGEAKKDGDGR